MGNDNASRNRKLIVIGLDGATFDLIKPWAAKGKLPTLKKLIAEGVHGVLTSTIPCATIPAWPSFATGCNPGKHSFYDSYRERDNGYEWTVEMLPSKAVKQPTLWDILSRHDRKVAVINVPSTYPPSRVDGYMITGMLTPSSAGYTYPPAFQNELESEIGKYNVFFSYSSSRDVRTMVADLESTLESRVKAALYLWVKKNPAFLMMVDNGTDRAEHALWRFIDPSNPLYDDAEVEKYGNPLLDYYQKVDKALQRFIALLDENTTLIIMSDHGQGSLRKFVNLNLFLIEEGFMKIKKEARSRLRYFLLHHGFSPRSLYDALSKLGIERLVSDRISKRTKLSLLNRLFFSTSDIDWSRTKAFATGITGGIRINVAGRESKGFIGLGNEYEDLRDKIIARLSQLKDPETGSEVVGSIYKKEDIYHGQYLDKAPDIIATASEGYEFFGMYGFPFRQVVRTTFGNSGSHRVQGIFMAVGPGIKRGVELKGASIIDIAPTILHIMDVPMSPNMDGKVLREIFEPNSELAQKEVAYQEESEKRRVRARIVDSKKMAGI